MMKRFTIKFIGRLNGALGIRYEITDTVDAPDEEAAFLKLYDKYEHIHGRQIVKVEDLPQT